MPKFNAMIQRDIEFEIEADDLKAAEVLARQVLTQFTEGTVKLMYIVPEGVVAVPRDPETPPDKPPHPFGRPNGGGSPGTPAVKKEVLADAVAKAA